ncbi:hypothetical protein GP486_008596, partial [Trichoglossum hirsutum]
MKAASFLGFSSLFFAFLATAVPVVKRDIEWVTVTDYTTVTVDMTTTLYVKPTKGSGPHTHNGKHSSKSSSQSPVQFYAAPPVTSTSSTPPAVTPAAENTPSPPPQQHPPPPPAQSPSPVDTYTPPPPPKDSPPSGNQGGSGSNGGCAPGSPCSGDLTYYEAGLGSCGMTNNGATDSVVALAHEFMEQGPGQYCGRTITISRGGKTTTAIVRDKCEGC